MYYKIQYRRSNEINWKIMYFPDMRSVDVFRELMASYVCLGTRVSHVFGELQELTDNQYDEERRAGITQTYSV